MMKPTALLLSATALLGITGCQTTSSSPKKVPQAHPHTTKKLTITAKGILYAIGDQHILLTGSETTKFNSASALRAHFQDGVRLSEARYLKKIRR